MISSPIYGVKKGGRTDGLIDVTDTGRGIPEHSQGTIFKRFYRDEAVHDIDGVGIGLYLAREIITMQGGYITVESKVGEGSTFSVFLPIK